MSPLRPPLGSLLSSSASCFFVASGLPSLSLLAGRPLDVLGHHRAACSGAGVLGSRGFSLESAAARVCREAGARVSTNLFVRDLDLPIANHDARRLEVVADGLPLFGGAQLAIDTTLVSSVQADGRPRPQCARVDGDASSVRTRNSLGLRVARGWWYWPPRWEAVGLTKPVLLSVSWPRPKPGQCLGCLLVVHGRRGNIGGHQCWLVRLLERLLCPFWTSARRWVQMGTLLPLLTLLLRAYRSAPRCEPGLVV